MRRKEKILVVEYNPDTLRSIRSILVHEKYDVLDAASAEEALDLLESQNADLVISELNMPGMSGIDFVKELHEWDGGIPVVFVHPSGEETDWLEAVNAGASDVLSAPYTKEKVLKAVHKAVKEKAVPSLF